VELLGLKEAAPTPSRRSRRKEAAPTGLPREELERMVVQREAEMLLAAEDLRFELAARLRDEIADLRREIETAEPGEGGAAPGAGGGGAPPDGPRRGGSAPVPRKSAVRAARTRERR
jgi:excinuclease ABC subunit B